MTGCAILFGFGGAVNTAKEDEDIVSDLITKFILLVFVEQPLALSRSCKKENLCQKNRFLA